MKGKKQLATSTAMALALSAIVSVSALAESRHQDGTNGASDRGFYAEGRGQGGGYRDNERVTIEGSISHITRDRDGYRVRLDRNNHSFWVPAHAMRNGDRDFRVGMSVRLGGIFRGGVVHVDLFDLGYGRGGYDRDDRGWRDRDRSSDLFGTIERIDYRRDRVVLREARTGRLIDVDMDRADNRRGGIDLNDLRRGDRVELSGRWDRGTFRAWRIDGVRSRRW